MWQRLLSKLLGRHPKIRLNALALAIESYGNAGAPNVDIVKRAEAFHEFLTKGD